MLDFPLKIMFDCPSHCCYFIPIWGIYVKLYFYYSCVLIVVSPWFTCKSYACGGHTW